MSAESLTRLLYPSSAVNRGPSLPPPLLLTFRQPLPSPLTPLTLFRSPFIPHLTIHPVPVLLRPLSIHSNSQPSTKVTRRRDLIVELFPSLLVGCGRNLLLVAYVNHGLRAGRAIVDHGGGFGTVWVLAKPSSDTSSCVAIETDP